MAEEILYHAPENGEMVQFSADVNHEMVTKGYVYVNIYKDASGNIAAVDNRGNPIIHRKIFYTMYTYSHADVDWSGALNRYLRISFEDGSKLEMIDPAAANAPSGYWYSIEGVLPVAIKPLT
jgi:hypothetical protein